MKDISKSSNSSGIGFCGLLTIVFVGLKLLGKIDWSWWWVLAPSWIPIAFLLAVICMVGLVAVIVSSRT